MHNIGASKKIDLRWLRRVLLMRYFLCSAVAVFLLAVPPAVAQDTSDTTRLAQAHTPEFILPGDVVRLRIWREPDLSGDFPIDETGEVVLPRIGPVKATSETPESFKAKLYSEYQKYLAQTSIDITVLRRVQVLGAVRNPGLYPLDATMTISDAVAMAGGVVTDGNEKKVELVRGGQKLVGNLPRRTRLADTPIRSGDQLYVPYRSWLSRNGYFIGTVASAAVGTITWLLIRRR
jgi:protein involved in polysaccharide export with SLBB domain